LNVVLILSTTVTCLFHFLTLETKKLPYKSSAGRLVAKVLFSMEEPVIEIFWRVGRSSVPIILFHRCYSHCQPLWMADVAF